MKKAAAAILTHGNKIFLIQRQHFLRVFPGYWAIPGGKVDPGETPRETVIRELNEEVGLELDLDQAEPIGQVTTPSFHQYRFETHYFLIQLDSLNDITVEENHPEFRRTRWVEPQEFLKKFKLGRRLMVPPLVKLIKDMAQTSIFDAQMKDVNHQQIENSLFKMEVLGNLFQVLVPSPTLPPAKHTNAFYFGDQVKILVDPSPIDEYWLGQLIQLIEQNPVDKIFLSHHHWDHHHLLDLLLKKCPNIKVLMSQLTHQYLKRDKGESYPTTEDRIEIVKDQDVITHWNQHPIRVYEVPGHDNGQLALAPDTMDWFFVGDLFQGVGTVVIDEKDGDMDLYLKSLQKIIDLNPKVIFPSHGTGLGGTKHLERIYQHRIERENQILNLLQKNKSIDQMLELIYFDIPKELFPYAKQNIKAHLKRIYQVGLHPKEN